MKDRQEVSKRRREKLLPALIFLLVALVVALPVTRWLLTRKPPLPPSSATEPVKRQYWQTRIKNDVSDKEAYLQLGILEERSGFYLSARRHLESARALGVPDKELSGPLGRALTHLADIDGAQAELEKAVALAPGKWEPIANLAGLYANNKRSTKANEILTTFWKTVDKTTLTQTELQRLLLAFIECNNNKAAAQVSHYFVDTYPNDTGGKILAARCAFAIGDLTAARTLAEAALKSTPDESAALYFYGLILQKQKDYDGALRAWQKANAVNPNASDVYERLGEEYARRGDFKRAAVALERVALQDQQLLPSIKVAEAYRRARDTENTLYWDSIVAGFQRNYSRALELAQKAMNATKDPAKKQRALSAVAEAYRGLGKKKQYLDTVLEVTKAGTVEDLLLRVHAYEALDLYDKRLACLEEIAKKDPRREASVRYERALIFEKTGLRDEMEQELERAVAIEPRNPQYSQELATTYLKRSSVGDRLERATRLAETTVALSPDDDQAWLTLGQCYGAKNQLGKAVRCIEHAIDLEAGNGPAYLELSRVYARMGNMPAQQEMMGQYQKYVAFEQQRLTLRTRVRRSDAKATDFIEYGDLLLNMGDTTEALSQYETAFGMNPKDNKLRETLVLLYKRMKLEDRLAQLEGAPR